MSDEDDLPKIKPARQQAASLSYESKRGAQFDDDYPFPNDLWESNVSRFQPSVPFKDEYSNKVHAVLYDDDLPVIKPRPQVKQELQRKRPIDDEEDSAVLPGINGDHEPLAAIIPDQKTTNMPSSAVPATIPANRSGARRKQVRIELAEKGSTHATVSTTEQRSAKSSSIKPQTPAKGTLHAVSPTLAYVYAQKSQITLPSNKVCSAALTAIGGPQLSAGSAVTPGVLDVKQQVTAPDPNDIRDHMYGEFLASMGYEKCPQVGKSSFPNYLISLATRPFFNSIVADESQCRAMCPQRFSVAVKDPSYQYLMFHASYEYDCKYLFEAKDYETRVRNTPLEALFPGEDSRLVKLNPCANGYNCIGISGLISSNGLYESDGTPFHGRILMAYGDPSVVIERDHATKTVGNCCLLCLRAGVHALSMIVATQDFNVWYGRKTPIVQFYNSGDYNPAAMLYRTKRDIGIVEPIAAPPPGVYFWCQKDDGRYYVNQTAIAHSGNMSLMYEELLVERLPAGSSIRAATAKKLQDDRLNGSANAEDIANINQPDKKDGKK